MVVIILYYIEFVCMDFIFLEVEKLFLIGFYIFFFLGFLVNLEIIFLFISISSIC